MNRHHNASFAFQLGAILRVVCINECGVISADPNILSVATDITGDLTDDQRGGDWAKAAIHIPLSAKAAIALSLPEACPATGPEGTN